MDQIKSPQTPHYRLGFTLSELLIVIGIVALLAAVLFPVFTQAREKAVLRQLNCQSNLKHIGEAFDQYLADNDDTYPDAFNDTGEPPCPPYGCEYYVPPFGGAPDPRHTWETSLLPYVKYLPYYACPDDPEGGYKGILNGPTSYNTYKGFPVSYSANGYVACYTAVDHYSGCFCRGVMCEESIGFYVGGNTVNRLKRYSGSSVNAGIVSSTINHPESTVEVTELYNADALASDNGGNPSPTGVDGNYSNWATWHDIGGQHNPGANFGNEVSCQLPSATAPNQSTAFAVCGVNGNVSAHHGAGKDLANFLFVDGHVALLSPPTTNPTSSSVTRPLPNGDTYDPNNQWDATRP